MKAAPSGPDSDRSRLFYETDVEVASLGLVSVSLRQIQGVIVSLPALMGGPSVTDPDAVTPVERFEAAPAAVTEDPAASD